MLSSSATRPRKPQSSHIKSYLEQEMSAFDSDAKPIPRLGNRRYKKLLALKLEARGFCVGDPQDFRQSRL